jgi:hypothetical protein
VPGRQRAALRPLPPDLPGPVRAFVERLRESYWERLELNQRELAAALHVSKSPISRYLNGQEIIPAQALERFLELAHHSPQERDLLRALRGRAEAAQRGDASPTRPPASESRTRAPRWAWPAAVVGVLVGAGTTAVVLSGSVTGGTVGGTVDGSDCAQARRQYSVTADGDVLDVNRNDVGDVRRGETFTRDTPPTNPYHARHYGHVLGRDTTGFVDQAKLKYLGEVCERG